MRRERTSEKRNKKNIKNTGGRNVRNTWFSIPEKKIDLDGLVQIFCEEHFTPDIVCKLTTQDFKKLGLKDWSLIMKLRIECSTYGSLSPPKGYKTN